MLNQRGMESNTPAFTADPLFFNLSAQTSPQLHDPGLIVKPMMNPMLAEQRIFSHLTINSDN